MSWLDKLKVIFPKPQIPQKRYLLLFGIALYYAAKVYVAWTPSPHDDNLPDEVRAIVFQVLADSADDDSNVHMVGDKKEIEQSFGERD
jgi:hypothetical protein